MNHSTTRIYGILGITLITFGVSACATTSPGSRPTDMSVAGHRAAAARHAQQAQSHAEGYDPNAVKTRRQAGGPAAYDQEYDLGIDVYNPTTYHKSEADAHNAEAQQHLAAAAALESFEEAECGAFPPETRVMCPLIGQVIETTNTARGVILRFAPGVNVKAATAHMRCHIAYGQTLGGQGMPQCPLYIKGVQVHEDGSTSVELTVEDKALVPEIQRRAATHVGATQHE